MDRKNYIILGALIVVLLCLRIPIIMFSFDKIYSDSDELSRGALAKEIIQGPMLPLLDYLEADAEVYEGGRLLSAISVVPFFLAFGDSFFSLKLTAIFYSVVTLICWYILLLKFFNFRVTLLWSILFILSPPFYTQASLITWGAHAEYYFFTALFFIIFYKIFFIDRIRQSRARLWMIFGYLSGLSIWIIQNNIVVLVTCFFLFFLTDKRFFFKRPFFIYCLSFLLGYFPGIYHFFTRHWQFAIGCDSIFKLYPREHIFRWPVKLVKLFFNYFPNSFMFKDAIISYFYYIIFAVIFLYFIRLNRGNFRLIFDALFRRISARKEKFTPDTISREFPCLLYFFVYLFVYTVGGLSILDADTGCTRYLYVAIVYPIIFALISLFLDRLWQRNKKSLTIAMISLFSLAGLHSNINLISFNKFGAPFREKGYDYYELGDKVTGARSIKGIGTVLKGMRWINPLYGPDFLIGIGAGMAFNSATNKDIQGILNIFENIPEEYRVYLYRGWGIGMNEMLLSSPKLVRHLEDVVMRIGPQYKGTFYSGLGKAVVINALDANDAQYIIGKVEEKISPEYLDDLRRGVAEGLIILQGQD